MYKSRTFLILTIALVSLCLSTVIIPYLLVWESEEIIRETPPTVGYVRKTARKALDIEDNGKTGEIRADIAELERIKLSVRNELRVLEQQRVKIVQETEQHKANLYKLQDHITSAKKELLVTQAELAKVSHEVYAVTQSTLPLVLNQAPPIIILPKINMRPDYSPNGHHVSITPHCTNDPTSCLNYTCCPLTKPFKVFLYSLGHSLPNQPAQILAEFRNYLTSIDSLTSDPQKACIFMIVLTGGDPSLQFSSLPYWSYAGDLGMNHVIVDLKGGLNSDPSGATLVQPVPSQHWRRGHDMISPPVIDDESVWKAPPKLVPAYRRDLMYFEGQLTKRDKWQVLVTWLDQLAKTLSVNESVNIRTDCSKNGPVGVVSEGWSLCSDAHGRSLSLGNATFALILSITGQTGLSDQIRLVESLRYGAIPVIVGSMKLPFDNVLDWSTVSLWLPFGRLHEVHYLVRGVSHDMILQMRRAGRFFWETYFSSSLSILKSVAAIMRYRLSHLPPVMSDYKSPRSKRYGKNSNHVIVKSHSFTGNSSVYRHQFWNRPPGPFFMFPQTPDPPSPVSGSNYATMSAARLKGLPPHIVQAGGITGPYFQNYLLGDIPEEYFTVVMLTYRREEVVKEAIERLQGLDHLAKVIVVWNDPENSPFSLEWPTLSVSLEVVWAEKNSLNNRFLPFDSIETEAVLSIDDDVYLRHDEIQFAFRVWRESRDRLVGFPGRFHAYDVRHRSWLYNSNYTCELSMVLTGAAFFHKYYSYLYTSWQPKAVRDMVDEKMNCEDIAMNFLIAHVTRKPPLKVTSRWTFRCPSCPDTLSQNDAHFDERHNCINQLAQIFGYMPLLNTQYRLDSVLFKTRLPGHLEKCYQYV